MIKIRPLLNTILRAVVLPFTLTQLTMAKVLFFCRDHFYLVPLSWVAQDLMNREEETARTSHGDLVSLPGRKHRNARVAFEAEK